ncbi:hypothetical protein PRIPAC_96478 [Pristionchus pacificus]|uniref:Uncharacterized protein n=1 Tax=Pristionchus pacificus TaxID=54126 RepID=A0A2A6BJN6_PRIPA|nr:hypothetical protein PRIPAC_96478 [Pristionchus pacificus]|eukprot:PDM66120.1 hypothetical protein PRIPAC_45345 [Pristionchus pacificus]
MTTTEQDRKVFLSFFSYLSTVFIFLLSVLEFLSQIEKFRFGIKNVLLSLSIMTIDLMISDCFKRETHITVTLVESSRSLLVVYLLISTIFAIIAVFAYSSLIEYFRNRNNTETEIIPIYLVSVAYVIVWYLFYTLLSLTLFLIEFLIMLFRSPLNSIPCLLTEVTWMPDRSCYKLNKGNEPFLFQLFSLSSMSSTLPSTDLPPSLFDLHPFDPNYFPAAIRNLVTMLPGLIAVIMLATIIYRKRDMYRQYKLTVVFLTFGGFSLAIPILLFNAFMVITSISHFNSRLFTNPSLFLAISILRYALVMHDKEMKMRHLLAAYFFVAAPLYIYFILAFIVGTIRKNDESSLRLNGIFDRLFILDTSHSSFSSLTFAIFEYCGFSFNTKGKCLDMGNVINEQFTRKERDQLHLSIGLLVQSITVTCTFGSTILFMLLFSYGISVPAWLSTITNTLSSISTLLNPLSAAIFIRPFRREMLRTITCSKRIISEVMGGSTMITTTTVRRKPSTSMLSN